MCIAVAIVAAVLVSPVASSGVRPAYGGDLRVVLPSLPQTFDPALAVSTADLVVARATCGTLMKWAADGTLLPDLLAAVPEVTPTSVHLKLRSGLKTHDGSALGAAQVVAAWRHAGEPSLASPYGALFLPVSSIIARGDAEIDVQLAFPYPDWPRGLAHPGSSIPGAGPFLSSGSGQAGVMLSAFGDAPSGRPYADHVRLVAGDSRGAARMLAQHTADVLMQAVPGAGSPGPLMQTTFLSLNPDRLKATYAPVRSAVEASIDSADLVSYFVRTPATPMRGLLPPPLDVGPVAPFTPGTPRKVTPAARLTLIVDASNEDHRSVAERIQVLLHPQGVGLVVRSIPHAEFQKMVQSRDYELAVVGVPALPEAGLALAQVMLFAGGRDAASLLLSSIGQQSDLAARRGLVAERAREMRSSLPLVPLYASGVPLTVRPGVYGASFDPTGVPSLADLWRWEAR
jgi:peptide/nickel transport system substrate-binding protein